MPLKVNVGGVWKDSPKDKQFVNVAGVWKPLKQIHVNVAGIWKPVVVVVKQDVILTAADVNTLFTQTVAQETYWAFDSWGGNDHLYFMGQVLFDNAGWYEDLPKYFVTNSSILFFDGDLQGHSLDGRYNLYAVKMIPRFSIENTAHLYIEGLIYIRQYNNENNLDAVVPSGEFIETDKPVVSVHLSGTVNNWVAGILHNGWVYKIGRLVKTVGLTEYYAVRMTRA